MLEEVGELLGAAVTLEGYLGHKGRAVVARLRLEDGSTVVVKGQRIPDDPSTVEDGPWSPPNRFRNKLTASQVLDGANGLVPALLATDVARQWMVLEDLGPISSLADALLGGDAAAAETALCGWASAIGRLHRFTADTAHLRDWERDRRALGGAIPYESATEVLDGLRPTLEELVPVGPDVTSAAREIDRRLDTRDWWVLSPHDTCPDNSASAGRTGRTSCSISRGQARATPCSMRHTWCRPFQRAGAPVPCRTRPGSSPSRPIVRRRPGPTMTPCSAPTSQRRRRSTSSGSSSSGCREH